MVVATVVPSASAPVTDATEGQDRLAKLRAGCGQHLEGSPELQAALGDLVVAIFRAGGSFVCTFDQTPWVPDGTKVISKPFDKNGVLYFIGTHGGTRPRHDNPHEAGRVVCKWSSLGEGAESDLVSHAGKLVFFLDFLFSLLLFFS